MSNKYFRHVFLNFFPNYLTKQTHRNVKISLSQSTKHSVLWFNVRISLPRRCLHLVVVEGACVTLWSGELCRR